MLEAFGVDHMISRSSLISALVVGSLLKSDALCTSAWWQVRGWQSEARIITHDSCYGYHFSASIARDARDVVAGRRPIRPRFHKEAHHRELSETESELSEAKVSADTRSPRLFLKDISNLRIGQVVELSDAQAHYIVGVLRLRNGSSVRIFDGSSGEFVAEVCGVGKGRRKQNKGPDARSSEQPSLCVKHLNRSQAAQGCIGVPEIELIFSPIRKQRLKALVEKAVEVGASRLTPVLTHRTQGSAADTTSLCKIGSTVIEAAEQCERMDLPRVKTHPIPLAALLRAWDSTYVSDATSSDPDFDKGRRSIVEPSSSAHNTLFVCKERDIDAPPLLEALADFVKLRQRDEQNGCRKGRVAFLVGPEGGFAPEEMELMAQCPSVHFVSLGPTVLRAETAALYALSCWSAFWATAGPSRK